MGLATVLGTARKGYFIPYRYAGAVPDRVETYGGLAERIAGSEAVLERHIDTIESFAADLDAIGEGPPPAPRWRQGWFPRLDAAAAYAMVRTMEPRRIVEIGSGHSTRFLARAVADGGLSTAITAIDPRPRAALAGLEIRHLARTLHDAGQAPFQELEAGDILFVDSSHILMPGSDVDIVLNRLWPALATGVVVHFHDIFLPDGYPASWAWRGYNEQLGVGALISAGGADIRFASHYAVTRMADRLDRTVVARLPIIDGAVESSLWLAKRGDATRGPADASERLIGWFQLVVVLLFGALYLISPKTFSPDAPFEPVPWVLGTYFVFTVARLALAYRRPLPRIMLYASVVLDMALLLGLIWSFHVQYMQPPSFYLKAPTLLYVFIFIALRALRFEARFVVAAGIVAALGWIVLAGYAVWVAEGTNMVTRDYVYYMTSNSILIGAEFDKVISILTVTIIIAVAITRARRLLIRSVAEGTAAADLSRFFAPEIAEHIIAAEHSVAAGRGQARDAAILNCDIRGFTVFATRVDPDELIRTLTEYQHLMVAIIQRHGGSIDKFMGDGIMATFGAAMTTETYAADALRALDDIMAAAADWNAKRESTGLPALPIGAAVSVGRIIFGAVGDETRLEYTVIGDAVNRAAKIEKQNKVEGVRALCDAATFDVARRQGYVAPDAPERLPARMVEGIDEPVDLVVLAR
jgi:adenylate cyclase